ncbi:MAG TPA: DUF1667 domain-containing protein [Bacillota bacterium]|jgi:CxxC motif-containing protein|nr:DUF1667 domain-containing protein [Bacillota bacterium]HOB87301.1 DUF1667 domain-containing protein [Bacillota bacterium]HOP68626.1 DUF1667 domain-containing protein [Bacillota bacterium]HPT34018.1 DUF1667 domain-containing protein [Bacillota bacterium]HPZ64670.1 DUF1667 domain-containing protein [Bacillota bacterium]
MTEKELICIVCPLGCKMTVKESSPEAGQYKVEGAQCARGKKYAVEEYTNPTRMVTSTVAVKNAPLPRVPVKTARPIPKGLVLRCMEELNRVELTAPVKIGDIVIENLLGTGVDVIATRDLG